MDERRFDDLARTLGASNSRRTVLKGLFAGVAGGVIGLFGGGGALASNDGNGHGNGNSGDNGHGNGNDNGHGNGNSKKSDCCPDSAPRLCDNHCVNFRSDASNCGGCGNICPSGTSCQSGTCVATGCTPGASQPCGSAVGACVPGTQMCQANGTWGPCEGGTSPQPETCNGFDDDCNGVIDDVDPASLANDPFNCGACGTVCVGVNSTPACVNGQCTVGSCNNGFLDCNDDPSDGCEVNINTDPSNCGGCGIACPSGSVCVAGTCQSVDCPDSGNLCIDDVVVDGVCTHPFKGSGTICGVSMLCDGAGNCVLHL